MQYDFVGSNVHDLKKKS
jgi:hypothetical protein